MLTRDDIQSFLDRVEGGTVDAAEIEPGLWRAKTQTGAEFIVNYTPPVVILRVRVMESPANDDKQVQLYRMLLELNARDLVHGSYGLEGEHIVLTDALELADLDFLEFEASWDSLSLALASHLSALAPYRER
jgi:hypothetical protein